MASFAWMKVLESTAARYDRGIGMLSGGRIGAVYRLVAQAATAGAADAAQAGEGRQPAGRPRVLDIGCGTGGVALACAALGADVVGIDRNVGMLEVARAKAVPLCAGGRVTWLELGAAEIEDRFPPRHFDAVTACLVLSEMDIEEQAYTLRVARTRLVPGGRVVIADEVLPRRAVRRWLHRARRLPVAALTYLLTQTTTRPAVALARRVSEAGFAGVVEERLWGDAFAVVRGEVPRAPVPSAGAAGRETARSP